MLYFKAWWTLTVSKLAIAQHRWVEHQHFNCLPFTDHQVGSLQIPTKPSPPPISCTCWTSTPAPARWSRRTLRTRWSYWGSTRIGLQYFLWKIKAWRCDLKTEHRNCHNMCDLSEMTLHTHSSLRHSFQQDLSADRAWPGPLSQIYHS